MENEKLWYVIQVANGQEFNTIEKIKEKLNLESVKEIFCPIRERNMKFAGEWITIKEKLFPGYIFIITDSPEEVFLGLKQVAKLTKLLGDGINTFIPLSEDEVEDIEKLCGTEREVKLSKVGFHEGNKVRIISGRLLDFEGKVMKINLHKRIAIVKIKFMGRETEVYLGIDMLKEI